MANFDNGVSGYVVGECRISVNFPVDEKGRSEIFCVHCPYLSSNERMCQLNKEPVAFPRRYVGDKCPLKSKEGNKDV